MGRSSAGLKVVDPTPLPSIVTVEYERGVSSSRVFAHMSLNGRFEETLIGLSESDAVAQATSWAETVRGTLL